MKTCLDLFSGLGGFSSAFRESEDWDVVEVDIEERFDPDICANILDLRHDDLPDADVVLASPPCKDFSIAASRYEKIVDGEPKTDSAKESVLLVYHTLGLIKAISSDYWFLENPRGYLRQFIGEPTGWVAYCQYGRDHMKPTELWGEHPQSFNYRHCQPENDCHQYNTDWAQGGDGNMSTNPAFPDDPAERAKVPQELSECILEAVENPGGDQKSAAKVEW
jgi:hypothetical protein